MSDLTLLIAVAVAGGVGAVLRYVVDNAVPDRWRSRYPWGTTVVNISGSFVIGVVIGLTDPSDLRTIATVGLLGGYTTFSTASLETVRLATDRRTWPAAANAFAMLVACVAAAVAGISLTS